MRKHDAVYKAYVQILKEELVPAMGCTEPIAVAYCAAKAKEALGAIPDKIEIKVSGNILKNVKSVVVPNTDGLVGVEASAAAGIIGGKPEKELEVISEITPEQKVQIKEYLKQAAFFVAPTYGEELLEIIVTVEKDGHTATAHIQKGHANIVSLEKDGNVRMQNDQSEGAKQSADRGLLNIKDIIEFADTVEIDDIRESIQKQIECNSAISKAGFDEDWGACIGKTIQETQGTLLRTKAKAAAAAGADARMSGCELPVIIVSGSGNQGITASMPVITYARELGKTEEELYRALCVSNLVTIHEKTGIGKMSAFCGALCAGSGAGAAIAYMQGADLQTISHTIISSLGIVSGMVCDGAKPSCAAKVAAAVDCGILGYELCLKEKRLMGGDGILSDDVEKTIRNVGRMGKDGMAETDHVIQAIMTE
ncbi:MAG: L-serine ammonia-lyase, iron-sulfur-dependent, subunit alpha [Bacillota bacterium]|jgi:L-cysteine desulfidase|nr:L-serine ammonia-lyase, iron-sulfur-dependent, subunit alpha [Eubacteriales bacterium]MDI9492712.1 L-serine ammonia-lyase, iron-sulfur-dependent, subunit alpha [Bacillota bacterium]NLV70966.1 serine dehydratase subunit alpha family protein [Clostridiales bacterium]MDD3536635.1 L-serine ammonia-lyase, iron-sulfur-dependent, subunit alpha [Eubacteriales bacterium]MDD4286073.1 L-serine ammonia-lyase, iron-sulfur-dependent, subunit alpha [Eubacteriales bacterium]